MRISDRTVMQLKKYPLEIQEAIKEIHFRTENEYGPDFFTWRTGAPEKLKSLPKNLSVANFWCEVLSHCDFDLFYKYYEGAKSKEIIVDNQKFMI